MKIYCKRLSGLSPAQSPEAFLCRGVLMSCLVQGVMIDENGENGGGNLTDARLSPDWRGPDA